MAEKDYHTENKSFLMYKEWEEFFENLERDEEVSQLIKALFAFAKRGEEAKFDGALKMAFIIMRNSIERDGKKWETVCEKNAKNGRKGGLAKKANATDRYHSLTNDSEGKRGLANLADKDKDKDKEKDKEKEIEFKFEFEGDCHEFNSDLF